MPSRVNKIPEIGNLLRIIGKRFGITVAFKETEFKIDSDGYIIESTKWDNDDHFYYSVFDPKSPAPIDAGFNASKMAETFLRMLVNKEIKELFETNEIVKMLLGAENG